MVRLQLTPRFLLVLSCSIPDYPHLFSVAPGWPQRQGPFGSSQRSNASNASNVESRRADPVLEPTNQLFNPQIEQPQVSYSRIFFQSFWGYTFGVPIGELDSVSSEHLVENIIIGGPLCLRLFLNILHLSRGIVYHMRLI